MDAQRKSQSDWLLLPFDRSKLNTATEALDLLSEPEYQQRIHDLSLPSDLVDRTRYDFSANSDNNLSCALSAEINSYVFSKLPYRLINLRTGRFELQDRSAIAKHLTSSENLMKGVYQIKMMENEAFNRPSHMMSNLERERLRDGVMTEWIEHVTQFAILSHTWERGELSYDDFRGQKDLSGSHLNQENGDQARSLKKLHSFCRTAKEFTEFAWADNICVDKSNTPELDESIRSMFSWYHSAAICIIYLAETNSLLDLVRGHDRWFTRGWTLQELLAPLRLKFYNKDWHRLTDFFNDKIFKEIEIEIRLRNNKSLSRQLDLLIGIIFKKTGISMEQICNFSPGIDSPSLPERMRWAARRSTTKEEDESYSLMGIFNVSISTAYGEGRERAFFRLFQAILDVGYRRDWFLWAGESISPSIHPSRMIPSSPRCYDSLGPHAPQGWTGMSDEPVHLTNIGLRMTILLVPVDVKQSNELTRFHHYIPPHATVTCPSISTAAVKIQWTTPLDELTHAGEMEFALGILNVNPEADADQYPDRLYGILLRSRAMKPWRSRSYARNWKKCDTEEIITLEHYDKFRLMAQGETEDAVSRGRSETLWSRNRENEVPAGMGFRTLYL